MLRDVGGLLVLVGTLTVVPLLVSFVYGEYQTALAFAISAGITAGAGRLREHERLHACSAGPWQARRPPTAGSLLAGELGHERGAHSHRLFEARDLIARSKHRDEVPLSQALLTIRIRHERAVADDPDHRRSGRGANPKLA